MGGGLLLVLVLVGRRWRTVSPLHQDEDEDKHKAPAATLRHLLSLQRRGSFSPSLDAWVGPGIDPTDDTLQHKM